MSDVSDNGDWIDDEAMSFDAVMERFESLEPVTVVTTRVPCGAIVEAAVTYSGTETINVTPGLR